jgi:pyruvate dehydrogenase E2 component (dihydrolipoamide acetyltransferase)
MESGVVVRWLKAQGDQVAKGDPLYELDTEKVTQEVEAEASGVLLAILAQEGEEVAVGAPVAVIGEPGEEVPQRPPPSDGAGAAEATVVQLPVPPPAPSPPATEPAPPARAGGRVKASPLARRMAKERGIDLASLSGTGPDGRIVAEDVEAAGAGAPVTAAAPPLPPAAAAETAPLSSMRRTIARRMSEAWQAPHFMVTMSADMTRAIALRERLLAQVREGDPKPTFSDLLTKLVAVALLRHPDLNAHFTGDALVRHSTANVGLAIAVDGGLVVPVITGCERRTIGEIAAARADLVARARSGRLTAADFEGGTFTISNLGMYGVERFVAILNPPQVAILAVGAIEDRVVAVDGAAVIRPRMDLTLSCDHRAIDGAQGSEFLRTVRELLEEPALAL